MLVEGTTGLKSLCTILSESYHRHPAPSPALTTAKEGKGKPPDAVLAMGAVLTGRERNYHYNCALGSTRAANRQLAWTPILGSFRTLRRRRRMEHPGAARMVSCRGDPLVFSERKQHGLSIEYTLSSPGVSLSSLLCCTLAVWTVTYPVSTYAQVSWFLKVTFNTLICLMSDKNGFYVQRLKSKTNGKNERL